MSGFEELSGAVYLVGPMTGRPRLNWPAFLAVWKCFLERGQVLPSAPHLNECGPYGINEWLDALDSGEIRLDDIDSDGFARSVRHVLDVRPTLIVLDGWRESEGTRAEVAVARRLRLPVFEVVYEAGVPVGAKLVGGELCSVLLSPDKTNECPRCGNSNEHSNPGTSDKEGQRG